MTICDSCNEAPEDCKVLNVANVVEDGPDAYWCEYCIENWLDHQSTKHYEGSYEHG